MDYQAILRLIHITCFAAWFGTVFASFFLLKTLEPGLTGKPETAAGHAALLQRYIKLETKVADVAFIGVILSGLLIAHFYHGWSIWVFVKSMLIILQAALTMGYIMKAIRPLSYPCTPVQYRRWYRLFTISFSMFALVLLITFFAL
jgi:putative membrane protein